MLALDADEMRFERGTVKSVRRIAKIGIIYSDESQEELYMMGSRLKNMLG